ncbi:DUF1292 domain-containing protein [Lagierella massiliensis]|uniref:DUF1292 domain-containing protein n=1 Tax=Lagierella massiliensis TaxID=1689303 RepID=UPI0006D7F491|nr:DUF1292 domain-containing protein [Lagierella massiliensis]
MDIIEIYNESNEIEKYYLVDTFGIEDDDYVVLKSTDEEDELLYIFKTYKDEDNQVLFEGIKDENKLDEVVDIYLELKSENDKRGGR